MSINYEQIICFCEAGSSPTKKRFKKHLPEKLNRLSAGVVPFGNQASHGLSITWHRA